VFHPQWNLSFNDSDFHGCDPKRKVKIEVVITDLPESFRDLNNYGHQLCGWNKETLQVEDDPGDELEDALRIRLSVTDDLEPAWHVVKGEKDDGVRFKPTDRAKATVTFIGSAADRDLTWSRGSLLSQLTDGENIQASLAEAARAARTSMAAQRESALKKFDEVASQAEKTAKLLGVRVATTYKADLDSDGLNVRLGGLAIHDGAVPVRQLGLGSRRMLITGLRQQVVSKPHITLIDEIESGLEPQRIARLLNHLCKDEHGQYFLTTHSPVVLRELKVEDLQIVHHVEGKTDVISAKQPSVAESIQGRIRQSAESFLCPRIVVCEGATEAGFLRGLDEYWMARGREPLAYQGVSCFDAKTANKVKGIAGDLIRLGYAVCVIADSDAPTQFSANDVKELREVGVEVVVWSDGRSIEEAVIQDLTWPGVLASFDVACEILGDVEVRLSQTATQFDGEFNRNRAAWSESPKLRAAIAKAAKVSDWFKRQSNAERWVAAISTYFEDDAIKDKDFILKLTQLRAWIDRG